MDNKLTRNFANELAQCAHDFTKPIVNEMKKSVEKIEKYYSLNDKELAYLLNVDIPTLNNFKTGFENDENLDYLIDLHTIALLTLLSNGRLSILTDTPSGEEFNKVNRIIKDYKDCIEPAPTTSQISDKIMQVLKMLGVNTEEDLDGLLKTASDIKNIIDNYDKVDEAKLKCDCENHCQNHQSKKPVEPNENKDKKRIKIGGDNSTKYVDENGNFLSSKPSDQNKIKGFYYDRETMDKPEEFEFKFDVDKILPNLTEFVKKMLK